MQMSAPLAPGESLPVTVNGHDASIRPLCVALAARVNRFLEAEAESENVMGVQVQTRAALEVIDSTLERYTLDEISISYNGGKDCLVLLILFLVALSKHATPLPAALESVYIVSPHPFAEVDDFVDDSVTAYRLNLARYAMPMREAFQQYLIDKPKVKAIFVGTRRTDPHGAQLTHFDQTDHGWPLFMRLHPVIDWHYAEIWTFIRHLRIPYCVLYDMGYTSLGGTTDTHPNPALKNEDNGEKKAFRPAYELVEDNAERLGRDR